MTRWRPWAGWRTAVRVARREARRAKGRATLVVAMIMLPVAALAFAAVTDDTFRLTPDEAASRLMGTAQAVAIWPAERPVYQDPAYLDFVTAPGPVSRTGPAASAGPVRAAPTGERLRALLPPGTRVVADVRGQLDMRTAAGTGPVEARLLDYADPLARGMLRQRSGQAPASADEAVLTPAASRRLGAGMGDTVRLADGSRAFRVVGIVEEPDKLRAATIVLHSGALPAAVLGAGAESDDAQSTRWLVGTPGPLTWGQVKELNTHGVVAVSRYVLAHPPSAAEKYAGFDFSSDGPGLGVTVLVGGLAMLEIVLLAGPAFAVSARRRRRELALVAAAGGTPAHIRRIVLADGVVLGVLAAVAGLVLGIASAAAGRTLLEEHVTNNRSGAFRVYPEALAGLAVVAVVTGVLAALVPAWVAARQDVVTALAGRRGVTRSRRRWLVLGGLLVAGGAGLAGAGAWRSNAALIVGGLAVVELGLVLCTPALVAAMARLGRWLPLAPRIALRDSSRNRTAAAPAVSAVMAAVVGSLAVGVVLASTNERDREDYRVSGKPGDVVVFTFAGKGMTGQVQPVSPDAVAALRAAMPVEQVHAVSTPSCRDESCLVTVRMPPARECPYSESVLLEEPTAAQQRAARRDPRCDGADVSYRYFGVIGSRGALAVVVDESAAGAVTGIPAEDVGRVAAALRSGAVVVSDSDLVEQGRVTLAATTLRPNGRTLAKGETRTVTAPGFVLPHPPRAPIAMMTPRTAQALGLTVEPFGVLATTSRMPTVAEEDRLRAALGSRYGLYVERGAPKPVTAALVVLAGVAGVITLAAAAIATGLAAADGRADLTTLAAVGASPRLRRALSLSQSGVIAGLGSVLGVAAGLGASTAVLYALNRGYADVWPAPTPYPIRVPWLNVGIALVAVPLVAMLGAGLLTRSRLPVERRL